MREGKLLVSFSVIMCHGENLASFHTAHICVKTADEKAISNDAAVLVLVALGEDPLNQMPLACGPPLADSQP